MVAWDEQKRQATLVKHESDVLDVAEIFGGKVAFLPARSKIEARQKAVAPPGPKMICVGFTVRHDTIRIFTARVARKNERERYQALFPVRYQGDEGPDELRPSE